MAPPILQPPPRTRTPWGLIIGIVAGVLVLAAIGIGGLAYWIVKSEKSIPMSPAVERAMFTLDDVERWYEEPWGTTGEIERSLTEEAGKTRRAEYTFDADDLWIMCELEYGGVGTWTIDDVDFSLARKFAPKGTVGELDYREDKDFYTWGERSWYSHILDSHGVRIGFYFIGYGSKRLITIEVVGLTIETQETVREILDPALEELGSFDLKAN